MRIALALVVLPAVSWADSPLTSIVFHDAYKDVPVIATGSRESRLAFLARQDAPNDQKLAVMTALGWENGANAEAFVEALQRQRPGDVSASDRFVAGYLLAMDDYLALKKRGLERKTAQQLLDAAAAALPDDFAVQYARALVQAQAAMDKSWCDVFRIPEAVKKRFPPAKRNLRAAALEAADGYLRGYSEECKGSEAATQKAKLELNQIYSVSKLGRQVVTGTQGGVVVWEPEATRCSPRRGAPASGEPDCGSPPAPVAKRDGFICNGLTHSGAVWVGCEAEVLRWDGRSFKSYLKRTQGKSSATYYQPMRGKGSALWVRLGSRLWFYDASTDRFQQLAPPWNGDAYDALVRANGEVWSIDFLDALVVDGKTIARKSAQYPGSDPRRFREDAQGVLWVEDFESGLFRYDDATKTFSKVSGLDAKASGIARDEARGRFVLLHYTDGLVLKPDQGPVTTFKLPELEFMRDLLLDENGDVWVAGWTGLMRLRPDGASFGKQLFVAQ